MTETENIYEMKKIYCQIELILAEEPNIIPTATVTIKCLQIILAIPRTAWKFSLFISPLFIFDMESFTISYNHK